jgi:hypothetical protein
VRSRREKSSDRKQAKSLNPKNEVEIDSNYYGDDENISTQIVTNYYYMPHKE